MGALEDDLTEHHRMSERDRTIAALRKELAEAKAIIVNLDERSAQYEAALETANARIAESQKDHRDYEDMRDKLVDEEIARAERAEARIAELESKYTFKCKYRNSGMGGNDPQDCAWPECGCDPAANKVLDHYHEIGLFERVEHAEARVEGAGIGELVEVGPGADIKSAEGDSLAAKADNLTHLNARAQRAEAHIKELNDKWADDVLRVERAEAECKAMREVLAFYANAQRFATGTEEHRCALQKADAFRAALNPSPAD